MGEVTPFGKGGRSGGPRDPSHDHWLRRQALQLVAQLPDDEGDALQIIVYMQLLMRIFLKLPPS